MKVYGFGVVSKFGELVTPLPAGNSATMVLEEPCLIMWHGKAVEGEDVGLILRGGELRWVLCLGSGEMEPEPRALVDGKLHRFPGRLVGLTWGLTDLPSGQAWDRFHPPWQVEQIREFLAATEASLTGPPAWALLDPPRVPEYVLACYICRLGGLMIEPEWNWRERFEGEVEYWSAKGKGDVSALSWEERSDIEKLRRFLSQTQTLVKHATGGMAP